MMPSCASMPAAIRPVVSYFASSIAPGPRTPVHMECVSHREVPPVSTYREIRLEIAVSPSHPNKGIGDFSKGYDSSAFVESIRATHVKAVTRSRSNRKTGRRYTRVLYRTRNIGERFSRRIKYFRRIAARDDTRAGHDLAVASLACTFGPLVRMQSPPKPPKNSCRRTDGCR